MVGDQAVIVAGIGFRRDCSANDICDIVRAAEAVCAKADALAAPSFKRGEAGLHEAAARLGLPLWFVGDAALEAAQPHCPTRSMAATRATGFASVAEAAAIGAGGVLLLPRIASARATCALARHSP